MTDSDFEGIVREHQGMVYSIAYHFFRNPGIAEEVAQDVFLQLYQSRRAIGSPGHLVAWLRRTVAHRCIDTLRQARHRHEVHVDPLPDIAGETPATDPLLQEKVRRLVASLPEVPRAVMILRYGEDMSAEEIGRTLKMPVRTVWSHLQRGMALIREKAARYLEENQDEQTRTGSS